MSDVELKELKETFDDEFSEPRNFGEEGEWFCVSQEAFPTKALALESYIAANGGMEGMEEEPEDLVESNIRPAFVTFHEEAIDEDGETGLWFMSQKQSSQSFPVWVLDTQGYLKETTE